MEEKNTMNTMIASTVIELSEHPAYIELVDRVCYYDGANANGVQLDYDDSSLDKARSLIDMPVVALYLSDRDGKPTLGGHAVTRTRDGIKFGTSAIGVHTNVWIEDAEIETVSGEKKTAKCLFSTMKIWNRFENMVAAVKRLFSEGRLHNSWEISVGSYSFEDGVKKLKDYSFIGNALLGEATPAYGSAASILSIASLDDDPQLLVAEALSADLIGGDSASNINHQLDVSSDRKEMNPEMEANENIVVEEPEVVTEEETVEVVEAEETVEVDTKEEINNEEAEVSEGSEPDESDVDDSDDDSKHEESEATDTENTEAETEQTASMKTDEDIRMRIYKAVDKLHTEDDEWYYVSMMFPEDHIVLVQTRKMPSLQFVQYSYEVTDDDVVLSDPKRVEMVISPLQINSEIETKNNAIANANNRIVELESQVAELTKAKQELDAIKDANEKKEHAEAVNKLRKYVEDSHQFTAEEMASEEVKNAIEGLNESWLKSEIADRFIASMASNNQEQAEVAEAKKNEDISIMLSEEESVTSEDVMRAFFNGAANKR